MNTRTLNAWIGALIVAVVVILPAAAQNFPSRPVRMVVPYPAGGCE